MWQVAKPRLHLSFLKLQYQLFINACRATMYRELVILILIPEIPWLFLPIDLPGKIDFCSLKLMLRGRGVLFQVQGVIWICSCHSPHVLGLKRSIWWRWWSGASGGVFTVRGREE